MTHQKTFVASYLGGFAGNHVGSETGPLCIKHSRYLEQLKQHQLDLNWLPAHSILSSGTRSKLEIIEALCSSLGEQISDLIKHKKFFMVLGGDHSAAIGTWSGAKNGLGSQKNLGLIWIDAHMDSHTFETTETGRIHGMPLAALLGYGVPQFTHLINDQVKLKPEQVCLIGVRSYEKGEAELLKKLNVRVFFIEEVRERGLLDVMQEAYKIASANTDGFGISLDIDSIDPSEAPATDVPEPNGLSAEALCKSLKWVVKDSNFLGFEIVEFNPYLDKNEMTEKLIIELIKTFLL